MDECSSPYEMISALVNEQFSDVSVETRDFMLTFGLYVAAYEMLKVIIELTVGIKIKEVQKNE